MIENNKFKMKTICILFMMTLANANTIETLKELMREENIPVSPDSMTLREYLDDLETPDPFYKVSSKRWIGRREANCGETCGRLPTLNTSIECQSDKWRPEYEKNGDCECLIRYRCCSEVCPVVDLNSCWEADDVKKGFLYGIKEVDCCGCEVVKCLPCEEPAPKEEACPKGDGARPGNCYSYTKNDHFAEDLDQCYRSQCGEKASDAPPDRECDDRCQNTAIAMSACKFSYGVCKARTLFENCPRRAKQSAIELLKLPIGCYHDPTQVDDDDGGHYYHQPTDGCKNCTKWVYDARSCNENNVAAAAAHCHQYGFNKMDKKCFKKRTTADNCGCDSAECIANPVEEPAEFAVDEVCPMNHVRMGGVSICMKPRDLCKQCKVPVDIDVSDCPIGEVVHKNDCNGCGIFVCQPPAIDAECECRKYTYAKDSNTMKCKC